MMTSYYHVVDGKRFDARILRAAAAVNGQPGRSADEPLGTEDLAPVLAAAQDGKRVTEIEGRTLQYVLDNYKVTPEAQAALLDLVPKSSAAPSAEQDDNSPGWLLGMCVIA